MRRIDYITKYNAVAIYPVYEDRASGCCTVVNNPSNATFWTVYGRANAGHLTALVDCVDKQSADTCAELLRIVLELP